MKNLMTVLILSFAAPAIAAHQDAAATRDYTYLCEITKMMNSLSQRPAFKGEEASLATARAKMLESVVETDGLKSALAAVASAEPKERGKLLHQSAKDAGLKNWNCSALRKF
jgi:hypothetical protein